MPAGKWRRLQDGLSYYTPDHIQSACVIALVDRVGLEPTKDDVQGLPAPLRTAHVWLPRVESNHRLRLIGPMLYR
jgi:hypothetical protein